MPDFKTILLILALGGVLGVVLLTVAAAGFKNKPTPTQKVLRIVWMVVLCIGMALFFVGGVAALGMSLLGSCCSALGNFNR
jgi:hypothetical protein